MIKRLIFTLASLICITSHASNRTVYYEPIITKLTGIIHIKVSPGPPNYESIKNGDLPETGYYLVLAKPIDVNLPSVKTPENRIDEPENDIKVIQLAIMHDRDWSKIKANNCVTLSGTLFHWFSGHHHTKVLMSVDTAKIASDNQFEPIKKSSNRTCRRNRHVP